MLVRPAIANWTDGLVTGDAVASAYEKWMDDNGFAGCGSH
jgi:hypothetical protein